MISKKEVYRNSPTGKLLMKQIFNLRYNTYKNIGWVPFSDKKSNLITDAYDFSSYTTHYVMKENGRVIAGHRSTVFNEKDGLPLMKNGFNLNVFNLKNKSVSELSRLVLRKDKKYHGCALQLAYNVMSYIFSHHSEKVCSIANANYIPLFEYMGTVPISGKKTYTLDSSGKRKKTVDVVPVIADNNTLNHNMNLDKYASDREFVVIKPDVKWNDFWSDFAENAYDYTNLLPENKRMLNRISQLIGKDKKVLDAGCGTGNLCALVAKNNQVAGIDLSEGMLTVARRKVKAKFRQASVLDMPFNNKTFDTVVSVNVIYNLDEPEKMIKEAFRVLKPGGELILVSPRKGTRMTKEFVKKVVDDCQTGKVDMKKFEILKQYNDVIFNNGGLKFQPSEHEIKNLLTQNGFKVASFEKVYYGINFLIRAVK